MGILFKQVGCKIKQLNGSTLIGDGPIKFKCISNILGPGLYDENDVMIASWDELVDDYGLDVERDYTDSHESEDGYTENPSSFYNISRDNYLIFSNVVKIIMPNNISKLGAYSMTSNDMDSLKTIVLPNSITSIGNGTFIGLGSITDIAIPNGVTSIGNQAFTMCRNLSSIEIPNSVTSIGSQAFHGCENLKSAVISTSVTSIESYTFTDCSILKNITIPNSVTEIGQHAFSGCSSLKNVVIPSDVISIGSNGFSSCTSLETIIIPESVTSIGMFTFYNCPNLTIYCEATSKPSGWDYNWNYENRPVVWGYKIN